MTHITTTAILSFAVGRGTQARCRIGGEDSHSLRLLFKFILNLTVETFCSKTTSLF